MPLYDYSQTSASTVYVGRNAVGGSSIQAPGGGNFAHIAKSFTTPHQGVLMSIDVYTTGNSSNIGAFYAALQLDNAGIPGDIACMGNYAGETTGSTKMFNGLWNATGRWVTVPMHYVVQPGTTYWMRFTYGGSGVAASQVLYYDTGTGTSDGENTSDGQTWINPGVAFSTANGRNFSMRGLVLLF